MAWTEVKRTPDASSWFAQQRSSLTATVYSRLNTETIIKSAREIHPKVGLCIPQASIQRYCGGVTWDQMRAT